MDQNPSYEDLERRIRELERVEVDLRHTEEALNASKQRFRTLFNEARDMVFIHGYTEDDIPGPFREVNAIACRRLGYTREELRQLTVSDIVSENEVEDIPATSRRLSGQKDHVFEKTIKTKSGDFISVEVNSHVFNYQNEKLAISIARDITRRKEREIERERLIGELRDALAKVKKLSGLLPICSQCKKIRDDQGYWQQIEAYIRDHSEAEFSHGICQECAKKMYPGVDVRNE